MICDRANILDISRRIDLLFFFFILSFIHLCFYDSFFFLFELVKNYDSMLRYNLCKIFYLWRVHLFELSCYFIITQFLPLYFQ